MTTKAQYSLNWKRRLPYRGVYSELRLSHIDFSPYLTESEGLEAVYKYAELLGEPITNETAVQINELCGADPFFISCVVQSTYPNRDLTTTEGVRCCLPR